MELSDKIIDQNLYMQLTMREWREILNKEVGVYVYGNGYIAKRFDAINYEFCGLNEAVEILEDNLYAILKFKYFIYQDDKVDKVIEKVVSNFTENIKTTLIRASFEWEYNSVNKTIKSIPNSCVAFKNGVFDFKTNKWLFKIYANKLDTIQNVWYQYNTDYVILWYVDIEFEELNINVCETGSKELNKMLFDTCNEFDNSCYRLIHNMSFDEDNKFSIKKFEHLCEILGFTLSNQFIQKFIIFIGSGSNGKNSLLDGCFSAHLVPRPTSISLDTIEEDKFVTGAFENKYHNFFLESKGKTYNRTEMLKQLTGSTNISIEKKGENKRSGYINVKHIFSGNDREKLKFGDSTNGFVRRINLYEVFYQWDSRGDYLKLGKYLKTNLSPDLRELRSNIINPITYIYLGMYGAARATNNFSTPFDFGYNDYNVKYENVDATIKKSLINFTLDDIRQIILSKEGETAFYIEGNRMYKHEDFKRIFYNIKDWKECVNDEESLIDFFDGKTLWINLNKLRDYFKSPLSQTAFNSEVTKITKAITQQFYSGQRYVPIKTIGRRIIFSRN